MKTFHKILINCVASASLMVLAALPVTHAWAASYNIDLGEGRFPTDTYGGAAGQPGLWNRVPLAGPGPIFDTSGGNPLEYFSYGFDTSVLSPPTGAPPEEEALVGDGYIASRSPVYMIDIHGLFGTYDVYLYDISDREYSTGLLTVNNMRLGEANGTGIFTGGLVLGVDYLVASSVVTDGALHIEGLSGVQPIGLAGIQIVEIAAIPLPAALPLFLTGLVGLGILGRKRRRSGG